MRNKDKNSWPIRYIIAVLVIGSFFGGCSKMDDSHKDFIKDGKIPYTGKADPISVHPGRNRLMLAWPTPSDPKATKAKLYWNNRLDSIEVPIDRQSDTTKVTFDDWQEGSYVFEVYTFDSKGVSSLKVELMAKVYGDQYETRLLSRPLDKSEFDKDTVRVTWGAAPDITVIGSEMIYEDIDGITKTLFIPERQLITTIPKFKPQTLQHRTLYKPVSLSLDTFYTEYFTHRVKGPIIDLNKAGWTATASSFDTRSGSSYRPPSNAIDGDPTTVWVNFIGTPAIDYPHTITVDMGEMKENIEGFSFVQRTPLNGALKSVELLTSKDGEVWESYGDFILENIGTKQFVDLPKEVSCRYFRVIAKNDYNNSKNVALAEVGVFTR